ncbi:MAG TPA: CRISPR-associated RAMP protein [Syntrophomonadaceae bacterium]|nr:CRISPR-associated RAMP protein Csx7 [Thermoanaerobacterales bacterium]HHW29844.1 CRISPR-associated RAMP protein [Syntrophomonadaceae bacterium]
MIACNELPFYRLSNILIIKGDLVCRTGIRVGAGSDTFLPAASDLPVLKDVDGNPYIPGSSLRGVLRSYVERIVRAFEDTYGWGRGACDPSDNKSWCITNERIKEIRDESKKHEKPHEWYASQVWQETCRVCRVFGSPWVASRVRISDLPCTNKAVIEVRDGIAIDREKETVANKYDFEVVPAGSSFRLEITAENLNEQERGLLWLGIKGLADGMIQIGGFKGRGLGQIALENVETQWVSWNAGNTAPLRDYLLSGKTSSVEDSDAECWLESLLDAMEEGYNA